MKELNFEIKVKQISLWCISDYFNFIICLKQRLKTPILRKLYHNPASRYLPTYFFGMLDNKASKLDSKMAHKDMSWGKRSCTFVDKSDKNQSHKSSPCYFCQPPFVKSAHRDTRSETGSPSSPPHGESSRHSPEVQNGNNNNCFCLLNTYSDNGKHLPSSTLTNLMES